MQGQRCPLRGRSRSPADVAELRHPGEHDIAPGPGRGGVSKRVELRRVLDKPGQQRRLRQGYRRAVVAK